MLMRANRREFLRTAGMAWVLSRGSEAFGAETARPNIVYILADDLGWGDLRCYNPQSGVPTPHADRFAQQSMRFTDMHSPSAVCTPTRYGILTGRYCWRTRLNKGVTWGYDPCLIDEHRLTVPAMLRQHGYYTAGVGKWHLGLGANSHTNYAEPLRPGPATSGFDYYYGIPASLDMDPYLYFENDRPVEMPTAHTDGSTEPRGVFWRAGAMAPHFDFSEVLPTLTRKTVSLLKERAAHPEQPFFLYFALPAPHTPWMPEPAFRGKSTAGIYGDFVAQVDDTFGQVLRAIDESGLAGNTLVIVTSDNGADWKVSDKQLFAHRANANWKGEKADIWDAGHRIPFMARWPGKIQANTVSNQLGCLTDLMSTVAGIVGHKLARDAGEDSYDLSPALLGKADKPIRDAIVHHSNDGMFSIRQGEWKLELGLGSGGFTTPVRIDPRPGGPKGQLYRMSKDPTEADNLWLKYPDVVARLTALLEKYERQGYSRPM
jgi:arylsulfatase A